MATGKMRCARCDYCGCTRKRLTLPYTQKTETSASGSARTTGSRAGRLAWKLSSGSGTGILADRRPARRLAAQAALEETIVVLRCDSNSAITTRRPGTGGRPCSLERAASAFDGPRLADADGRDSFPGPPAARSDAAAASSGLDNHRGAWRPRRRVLGGLPSWHDGSIPPLPVALELESHSVRRACVRAMAAGHQHDSPDRTITTRSPAAASLASILTRRQHSWRPHGVGAAGGWHAGAVRGWRGGIHENADNIAEAPSVSGGGEAGLAGWRRGSGGAAAGARSCQRF